MKRTLPWLAAAGAMTVASFGALSALSGRDAEAETTTAAAAVFVRPTFEPEAPKPDLDLTRAWTLSDKKKLVALTNDSAICQAGLNAVNVSYAVIPAEKEAGGCGIQGEAIQVSSAYTAFNEPQTMTCGMAARLYVWEMQTVEPAAEKYLGAKVVGVKSLGSLSCRRVAGYGRLSEHAFGKAADIAAFKLSDGRTISVKEHYWSKGPEGQFLRDIHKQACELFDVTLGPAYNADHHDHFHLDVGGNSACR